MPYNTGGGGGRILIPYFPYQIWIGIIQHTYAVYTPHSIYLYIPYFCIKKKLQNQCSSSRAAPAYSNLILGRPQYFKFSSGQNLGMGRGKSGHGSRGALTRGRGRGRGGRKAEEPQPQPQPQEQQPSSRSCPWPQKAQP